MIHPSSSCRQRRPPSAFSPKLPPDLHADAGVTAEPENTSSPQRCRHPCLYRLPQGLITNPIPEHHVVGLSQLLLFTDVVALARAKTLLGQKPKLLRLTLQLHGSTRSRCGEPAHHRRPGRQWREPAEGRHWKVGSPFISSTRRKKRQHYVIQSSMFPEVHSFKSNGGKFSIPTNFLYFSYKSKRPLVHL